MHFLRKTEHESSESTYIFSLLGKNPIFLVILSAKCTRLIREHFSSSKIDRFWVTKSTPFSFTYFKSHRKVIEFSSLYLEPC